MPRFAPHTYFRFSQQCVRRTISTSLTRSLTYINYSVRALSKFAYTIVLRDTHRDTVPHIVIFAPSTIQTLFVPYDMQLSLRHLQHERGKTRRGHAIAVCSCVFDDVASRAI